MHLLVTGGAGFIGSHLTDRLLADGHTVRVLDDFSTGKRDNLPPGIELVTADVADPDAVHAAAAGTDAILHLAAVASVARANEAWLATHRTNCGGSIAVLDAARAHGGLPVVYASSAAIYGDTAGEIAREDRRPGPQTAYGADKLASEHHAAAGWTVHRVPSVGLRFFNVYGPRQDPTSPYSGVISIFSKRLADGQPVMIHGDGGQTRDFVHVSDVVAHLVAALHHAIAHPGAAVLNVCTGHATSVRGLASAIAAAARRDAHITHGPARAGDIRTSLGDPTRATTTLGIAATTTLAEGLATLLGAATPPRARGPA